MRRSLVRLVVMVAVVSMLAGSVAAEGVTMASLPPVDDGRSAPPGYVQLVDPLTDSDIQDLIAADILSPNDIVPSGTAGAGEAVQVFRTMDPQTLITVGGPLAILIVLVAAPPVPNPKERPELKREQAMKFAAKVWKIGGPATYVACQFDYLKSPPRTWDETEKRSCARAVMALTHLPEAAMAVDQHLGRNADLVILNSSRGANVMAGHAVFEVSLDGKEVTAYPPRDANSLLKGGITRTLDVSVTALPPGRIVLPVRAFEVGGMFRADWSPKDGPAQEVTLTRVSDGKTITYRLDSDQAQVSDGTVVKLDVPPTVLPPGRTMLPFRASFTPFCLVEWYPRILRAAAYCKP